jgi:tetratricopeptide (TPR) repeat protein
MNEGKHVQALNTIGIDRNENDSDMAVEVKAISLQVLNQIERSVEHYEELYKRKPNPLVAYELADLKIQLDDLLGATKHITFGVANSKSGIMRTYYESQSQYQVPMKAAFIYLKGLVRFKENKTLNIDAAIEIMDEALAIAPNFNLAQISKDALLSQKTTQ